MNMKINVLKRYVILLLLGMMSFSGCVGLRKIQDMEVNAFKVESMSPRGFKGMVLKASLELDNPAMEISLSDIVGTLEHSGKVLGNVTVNPLVLHAKSVETYSITADMTLGDGASLLDLGKLLDKKTLEECTVDLQPFHFSLSCIGEGNGTPLQCSCLENPRDSGAWWATIYGVAQSRTRLK